MAQSILQLGILGVLPSPGEKPNPFIRNILPDRRDEALAIPAVKPLKIVGAALRGRQR